MEVVHLKKYTALKLVRNDFRIPFIWAETFLKHQGVRQLGKGGFAHARNDQLLSLLLAPAVTACAAASPFAWKILPVAAFHPILWGLLNLKFIAFLQKERGLGFALLAWIFTFVDHHIMLSGAIAGFVSAAMGRTTDRVYGLESARK